MQQPPDETALGLLIPENDVDDPEVTILVPALNEALTIGEFVRWCKEGLQKAAVVGEVLIVDSSSDETSEIALKEGARVLKTPRRGLGRAYLDGAPFARGRFFILGDCDLTYDFRELAGFVDMMRDGADFVMGSRFKGYIEPGAMPRLHQYFGTPVTTWILNKLYKTHYSDIHCGMRGVTHEAFFRLNMQSQSWEYASEMVLKAAKLHMNIAEIPVRFYKDREGRLSHHKRSGWLSPWKAGWINLRVMLLQAPDFFLLKPGLFFFLFGFPLAAVTAFFQPNIGSISLNLHWLFFFICLTLVGVHCIQLGLLGKVWHDYNPEQTARLARIFSYNRGMLFAGGLFCVGSLLCIPLIFEYLFSPFSVSAIHYVAIFGAMLSVIGLQTMGFTLLFTLQIKGKRIYHA